MKALVTGSAGFIGSAIARALVERGDEVIGIDNLSYGDRMVDGISFHELDIRDYDRIKTLFKDVHTVFHTAAVARTMDTVEDPRTANDVNITGTLNVLEAARANNVKRLVHSSSCILYIPNTPYYVGKLAGEEYVKIYPALYGLSTIALRYANVYGKSQSEKGTYPNVLAAFKRSKAESEKLYITGDGTQTRDFTHVSDVVRANLLAAKCNATGPFDICTGKQISLNEIASYYDCEVVYTLGRPGDAKELMLDPIPAEKEFGFMYSVELSEGIADML